MSPTRLPQGQALLLGCRAKLWCGAVCSAWHGPWSLALPLMSAVGTPCARRPAADTWAMQAAIDSCSQQACTLLHSRTLFATEGGVYLHNRVRFFSTAKANIHSLGGNGEAQGLRRVGGEWLKYRPQCACLGLASPRGTVACPGCTAGSLSQPARWQTAKRVHCAGRCRHRWVLRLPACHAWPAGEGVTLQAGSYSEPISFSGIYGFSQWGLRVLVGGLLRRGGRGAGWGSLPADGDSWQQTKFKPSR